MDSKFTHLPMTTATISLPSGLLLRLDKAAAHDMRTRSQYMQVLLNRILPPLEQQAQVDLEELISAKIAEEGPPPTAAKRKQKSKGTARGARHGK